MAVSNRLDVLNLISEDMRAVLDTSNDLSSDVNDTGVGLARMRANYLAERSFWNEGGPKPARIDDSMLSTPHGDVGIRFYRPALDPDLAAIVYIHGGGFILGNLDTHDRIMRILAVESGACVVGIDYSLSPEAKFPVAIEQCASLVRHLRDHGADVGIDPTRLGLAGDSGGAMMSLATALWLRDNDGDISFLKALVLYYGMYGLRDSVSRRLLGGPWDGLTEQDLEYYMQAYCASTDDERSPYVDCLSADLRGIPPCYVAAAEFDPLRDDSAALALMLKNHDIACRHEMFDGVLHAFLHNSRMLDASFDALRHGATYFRECAWSGPPTT